MLPILINEGFRDTPVVATLQHPSKSPPSTGSGTESDRGLSGQV